MYQIGKKLTNSEYECVTLGKFNADTLGAILIVGNGSAENNRSNALWIEKSTNNAYFNGDVYTKDKKVATQAEVNALNTKIKSLEEQNQGLWDRTQEMGDSITALWDTIASMQN